MRANSSVPTFDVRRPQIVSVSDTVRRRKRVHRGTIAAHIVVGLGVADMAVSLSDLLRETAWLDVLLSVAGMVAAVYFCIYVRRMRRRQHLSAKITLAAGSWLVIAIPFAMLDVLTGRPDLNTSTATLGFLNGFATSTLYKLDALVDWPSAGWLIVIPVFRFVKGARRWRHPVLLFIGIAVAIFATSSFCREMKNSGLPPWAFLTLVVIVPAVALAAHTALRALRGPASEVEWEGPGPLQGRRLFTGRQPVRVLVLLAVATVLCPLGIVIYKSDLIPVPHSLAYAEDPTTAITEYIYVTYVLGFAMLWLGVAAYQRARRHAALNAAQVRAHDRRAPLLYLRSFSDESLRIPAHGKGRRSMIERSLGRRTDRFEEIIVWHLWKFGPVIGVGRPGDRVSPLGAAREYLPEDTWRQYVDDQMTAARLIVVQVGRSHGIEWEIARLRSLGLDEKALFIIPPVASSERIERWREFCRLASGVGWPPPPCPLDPDMLACRLVDGAWMGITGYHSDEWNYEIALEVGVAGSLTQR